VEFRQLGHSGLQVPVLSFGAGTVGGATEFFKAWGSSDVVEATRLVDICLEAGVNLFDTADVYSRAASEEILGKAIAVKRNGVLISSKATLPMGDGPNDLGSSSVPPSSTSSWAPATKRSSAKTSALSAGISPKNKLPNSTTPATRNPPTPTGTSANSPTATPSPTRHADSSGR
jgi:aryl-alcohol dehydrogenase-like predicted oxidoreductase